VAGAAKIDRHSPPCAWRIDRFDLIFYNARHKRWQFFAEDPAVTAAESMNRKEEGLHRFQIRSLLGTFRKAVQLVLGQPSSDGQNLFELSSSTGAKPDIPLVPPTTYDFWRDHKGTYLEYLIRTAWHDGVPDDHRRTLQQWFNGTCEKVPRESALTFLSLLPILEEWDTWGCFIRARTRTASPADSFPPEQAGKWSDPLYVAELDFSQPNAFETPSRTFLGETVEIEGLCLNLAEATPVLHKTPKADFFDNRYCKRPTDPTEALSYRFYSALVDPILRGIAGGSQSSRQFVIAYPLNVAGRLHFLQIALSPSRPEDGDITLLWDAWQTIHRTLWTPVFSTFLREELQRIITSAFHSEVRSHLKERTKYGETIGEPECLAELYPHIYHLFPVHSVSVSAKVYAYKNYLFPETEVMNVGNKWEETSLDHAECPSCKTISLDGATILVPLSSSDALDDLTEKHRIRQSIEQQKEFLQWLPEGLEKARKEARVNRELCREIVTKWRQNNQWREPTMADLDEEQDDVDENDKPRGREPFPGRHRPSSLRRYVSEAFGIAGDDDTILLDKLNTVTRPSLLLRLSEYFETGPAKVASHPPIQEPYFIGDIAALREISERYYTPLCQSIMEWVRQDEILVGAVKPGLSPADYHATLLGKINSDSNIDAVYVDGHSLVTQHQSIRVRHLWGIEAPGFRSYWLDPMIVLKPCLSRLAIETEKYLPDGCYARKLSGQRYPKKWVHNDGFPAVECLEHFICFGTVDAISLDEFSGGNVCILWKEAQQAVADLLVHTKAATHIFCQKRLVLDVKLHEQLLADKVAGPVFAAGAQGAVVIRFRVWRSVDNDATAKVLRNVSKGQVSFAIKKLRMEGT
jgi:hypothetical protein